MVAMPYILVNLVLEIFSWILFCMTSAALLSKYSFTNRYLPAQLRTRKALAFVAQGLVLAVLSIVVVLVVARGRKPVFIVAQSVFEWFFNIGFVNSVALTYQFLDSRYFRSMPTVPRRLVFAIGAVVMSSAAAIAVFAGALKLFMFR